jgi:hypothetical protein
MDSPIRIFAKKLPLASILSRYGLGASAAAVPFMQIAVKLPFMRVLPPAQRRKHGIDRLESVRLTESNLSRHSRFDPT